LRQMKVVADLRELRGSGFGGDQASIEKVK
jgi:hypothetical protein